MTARNELRIRARRWLAVRGLDVERDGYDLECVLERVRHETIEACASVCNAEAKALFSSFADEAFAIDTACAIEDKILAMLKGARDEC